VKIAFVVQRYGTEILGGSEYHCRLVAERMAERHEVEVLTTCARDYITWKNEYPAGEDRIRGVTVRRFPNAITRDISEFNKYSDWIFHYPHSDAEEEDWLKRQGPWCPPLIEYLERHHRAYDALTFFTYLYAPTVLGLRIDPMRSVLVPTAHDEPAIRLRLYRDVFERPAAMAYNTAAERAFLRDLFDIKAIEELIGCGVDVPAFDVPELTPRARRGRRASGRRQAGDAGGGPTVQAATATAEEPPPFVLRDRGAVFRRRHRLEGPIVLYGGRIDPGKGCEELIEYFRAFVEQGGEATLALMGMKLMPIPEEPFIRFAGMLPDNERLDALEAATVVVVPSPYESLSLLALEAFAVGTPVLANGRSAVLVDHCRASNAGLYYGTRDEFIECLTLLLANGRLREEMGRNGQRYVQKHYRWDIILGKYDRLLSALRG